MFCFVGLCARGNRNETGLSVEGGTDSSIHLDPAVCTVVADDLLVLLAQHKHHNHYSQKKPKDRSPKIGQRQRNDKSMNLKIPKIFKNCDFKDFFKKSLKFSILKISLKFKEIFKKQRFKENY